MGLHRPYRSALLLEGGSPDEAESALSRLAGRFTNETDAASAARFYRQYLAGSDSGGDRTCGAGQPRGGSTEAASTRDWIERRCTNLDEHARGRVAARVCGGGSDAGAATARDDDFDDDDERPPGASVARAVEGRDPGDLTKGGGEAAEDTAPVTGGDTASGLVARIRAWAVHVLFAEGGVDALVKAVIAACVAYVVAMEAVLFLRRIRRTRPHR